jgi:hypothetical protein
MRKIEKKTVQGWLLFEGRNDKGIEPGTMPGFLEAAENPACKE